MDASERDKLRILILDDHAVVRRAIKQIILAEGLDPLEFGEGKAGPEGLDLALGQPWDLVVAVDLPGREMAELKRMRPDQLILVLGVHRLEGYVEAANSPDDLVSAVRRILAYGSSGQSTRAMEVQSDLRGQPSHEKLSNREREVLRLISSGRTVQEIAAVLALSEKTISSYRSRILTKVGLKTTAELIRYALMNRLSE
jgi:two-component system, NarL family, invasion response regulator UvrY